MRDCLGVVVENKKVAHGLLRLGLETAGDFPEPVPGQFVNLRYGEGTDPLLRRPFSVYSFSAGDPAHIGILYAPVGRWTRRLASSGEGTAVSVLGPLGKGFVPGEESRSILVAGGRGVAPLIYLAESLAGEGREFLSLVGARSKGELYWDGVMGRGQMAVTTEDGSAGTRGLITDLLESTLAKGGDGVAVYCCGPIRMLRKVSELCGERGVPCQTSVETVFACGIGICRGCSVPPRSPEMPYLMACSDGPVLRAGDVNWELFAP